MIRAVPSPIVEMLEYRAHGRDLLALVLADPGRTDLERDAINRVGIAAAALVEALDNLNRARLR